MKLGFWTLGAPAPVPDIVKWCRQYGYEGVDLRATRPVDGKPEKDGQISIESSDAEVQALRQTLADEGIEIPILLCYHPGGHADVYDWDWYAKDIAAHARLAEELGSPQIRLNVGDPAPGVSWSQYLRDLFECTAKGLEGTTVGACYENHPGTANAEDLLKGVEEFGDDKLGVIFSPDHCFTMQEDIVGLIERYSRHIVEISYADRKIVQEDLARFDGRYYYVQYESCSIGEGDLPNERMFSKLDEVGYDGYVSLKWEKSATFGHHLPPLEEGLALFSPFMRQFNVLGKNRD